MFQYAIVAGVIGLTFPTPHKRDKALQTLIDELRLKKFRSGDLPAHLEDARISGFFPLWLLVRLSKWANFDDPAEAIIRKLLRLWLRHNDEVFYPIRRLVEGNRDRPIPGANIILKEHTDGIITAWGGTPSTDPVILTALGTPLTSRPPAVTV